MLYFLSYPGNFKQPINGSFADINFTHNLQSNKTSQILVSYLSNPI